MAFLPSLLELFDASMRLEAEGRTSQVHATTDAKPRATLLESQISIAGGPTEAGDGAESERSAGQNLVSESASKVCKCHLFV